MVPAHFDVEVYAALRRLDRRGALAPGQLDGIVPVLRRFRAERIPLSLLLAPAHALGSRFSPPDALYAALALRLGGELLTRDGPLAHACAGLVDVRLI